MTVFGKEAVISYDMQCSSSSGVGVGDDIGSDDDMGGVIKVDSRRIVVKQTRKWELSNGKWLQTTI